MTLVPNETEQALNRQHATFVAAIDEFCQKITEQAQEIKRLRAALRNMDQHMEENITLTEALRQEQEWVIRLSKALRGVLRVADRNTKEFIEARAALGGSNDRTP